LSGPGSAKTGLRFQFVARFGQRGKADARRILPKPFLGLLKAYLSNIWMLKRIFAASVILPNITLNAKLVKELFGLEADTD